MPYAPAIPFAALSEKERELYSQRVLYKPQAGPRAGYRRRIIDERLLPLEFALGRTFKRPSFLELGLTHRSAAMKVNNDRLEFLGDRVVNFVVADWMYLHFDELDQNEMNQIYGSVTSRETQARRAKKLLLGRFARLGKSLDAENLPDNVLSNLYEAVIGAMYLDGGLKTARRFVVADLVPELHSYENKNYKSMLKDLFAKQGKDVWGRVMRKEGSEDAPIFTIMLKAVSPGQEWKDGETLGVGRGENKLKAEQDASHMALKKLGLLNAGDNVVKLVREKALAELQAVAA